VHSSTLPAFAATNITFANLTIYTPSGAEAGNEACTAHRGPNQSVTVKRTPSMSAIRTLATAAMAPYPKPWDGCDHCNL
jgi:hypothetical protein